MAMEGGLLVDFPKIAFDKLEREVRRFLHSDALDIMGVEALRFIRMNFDRQGFMSTGGVHKWQKRKQPASMYYKRGKKAGQLTKTGKTYIKKQSKPIFSSSSGSLMRNSFDYSRERRSAKIYSHLSYAFYHNYGTDKLPRRMFIGPSDYLQARIAAKINKEVHMQFGTIHQKFKVSNLPPMREMGDIEDLNLREGIMSNFDWEMPARFATKENLRRVLTAGVM